MFKFIGNCVGRYNRQQKQLTVDIIWYGKLNSLDELNVTKQLFD